MAPIDFALHLLGFVAPAVFVALAVVFGARFVGAGVARRGWAVPFAINFTVGALVLAAGLWHFGVDGKMMTYAGMVVAIATSQWLLVRTMTS